ncbi:GTP 3',8-cyclase MoaA [Psychrobacter frigidicola]|uniref:GTP 3',8-cyclase MoaA n=1 Tax=Psychrobacter frigidicola TaxID=45611 RepID=A0A5C7A4G7_9GAMM|nr:GTP 3',8-cyclase MoaA [Psychrobacter frigidicola]TXD98457.1 GTP 3',8-cyclase MoaA [Psychrobacter frigidicola]
MTYHAPTIGNAQLYSPVATPVIFDGQTPSIIDAAVDNLLIDSPTSISDSNSHQPLTDSFSRRLTYLRLSITDFCNFRCEYCLPNGYQGKRPDDELSVSEIATLISGFAQVGTEKVRITGGEPSIRRDVVDIIDTIKSTDGIKTVAMTSNGYKLGKHLANWNRAGLNQINISMDSFDAATFHKMTGFDMLPQLLTDMDKLLETTDIKLKINSILMAENAFENLIRAMDYVKSRPVIYRFIEFMQTSDNSDLFFAQHAQSDIITEYLLAHGWQANARGSADGPAIEYSHPDYVGRIGMIAPYAAHFCDNCNRLRVSSLGKVHLCLFDQGNYDIRKYLRQNDVDGLIATLRSFMPIKPEHHHLHESNSGMMNNLSMIGG